MQHYVKEARILLSLAIPVMFAQVSQTAMGVVDTIMSGAISHVDMAVVAVGTSIWMPVILFGHALLLALTPTIAHLDGSGYRKSIIHQVHQGFWLAFGVSVFIMFLLYNSHCVIEQMHSVEPLLVEKVVAFLRCLLWGTPGYLFFQVLRCQCEGLSRTKPGMIISFFGLMSNIPINYIFIHGKLGMPALGGIGCAVATASVYWIMFLLLWIYTHRARTFRDLRLIKKWQKPDPITLNNLFKLGLPLALGLFFEATLFTLVALLLMPLGIVAVAGHQIALNFSSLMFVLPLSVGVTATVRIGYRLGQGDVEKARISAWSSLMIGVVIACCTALFTTLFRERIALLYNNTPAVVTMASHLMLLAGIYQISDSIQVISNGVLRGYKDTRSIFFITFSAYWLLGLPSGYILALTDWLHPAMGPKGFWFGFIIGLSSAAILMIWRIYWLQKQTPAQILHRAAR